MLFLDPFSWLTSSCARLRKTSNNTVNGGMSMTLDREQVKYIKQVKYTTQVKYIKPHMKQVEYTKQAEYRTQKNVSKYRIIIIGTL